ncbi:PAS domain-containing protein [Pseudomonas cannabina]|uniref:histidine kinase n=1 Tax=Pseudomonas syringae pv. maculicola str. ES4326 TaxID=629265 RepID=A0A8T8C504_PSEYM|nr:MULTISPECIES: PAS domain-containing protein [Pseudomonas syringae group]KPB72947.1 Sensory box histidine kinase/response regulator [Pseudomonas syringae pv. maculicola]QHE98782.1 PAS domain-containing protein [Pseudomonas syringae pv. maculicola str. ES4326]QQN21043.1 PAS domain-containing protein [Pseudomonas cannabina pv. alisalensis]UBY99443.1 PAS domain-containing protein [Pseudomonas cannabina pv. alisalensis]
MGRFIRETDWSTSALGPKHAWPAALLSALNLMLSCPDSMYLLWGRDFILFFNDAYCPVLPVEPQQAQGQPIASVWGDAWEAVRPLAEQALAGHSCRSDDIQRTVVRGGKSVQTWWSLSYSPLYGDSGLIEGVFSRVNETTSQVLAEARQNENEAFTDRVLSSINDCIKVLDLDSRLTFMSEGGQRIMEVSDFNAIRGCPWPDFWQNQGNLDAIAAVETARAGRSASFMGSAQTLGGNVKWWHVQVSPIFGKDGKPEKILCVSRDMTQLRDAEEALLSLNETLEQRVIERTQDRDRIWRLSTDLMLVAQFDGIISAVNPAWTQALGWSEEQLLDSQFLALVHPDDIDSTLAAMSGLENGQTIPHFKNRYRHKDGSYRTIAWTAVPDKQFIHAVGRDIQAEEAANEALRVSQEALHQAQKLEAIGQLTGGVAHDFNNLLTVIRSCSDLLKSTNLDETRRMKYVEAISSTVDRAARLTGQLLAFARRQALQPEVFDVCKSVARIGEMMDTLTGSRIQVHIDLPPEPCFIFADGSQFDTALVNMVVNARDAMAGSGRLTIKVECSACSSAELDPSLSEGNYVTVSLTDTGSGIPKDKLGLIFEPFYTTKSIGQGTGLGLSQVFGFAKQSGGEVLVESELGSGSRFTLCLPSAQDHEPVPEDENCELNAPSGLCVLMVEDNQDIGTYTRPMLEQLGFQVLWVSSAREALHELSGNPENFHVVFSDIAMPGMSGLELYAEIEARYPWMPVVLTTGYSTEFATIAQDETHRFDLLQKPYSREDLAALLHKAVCRNGEPKH